jgi:single-strand DNA-binding protein
MNNFVGIGNLVRDPEMRYTAEGTAYTKFTIAINSSRKGGDTLFLACTAWEKTAENVAEYLRKGDKCAVMGEIREDKWEDRDGTKRSKVYCNARNVEFLNQRGRSATSETLPAMEMPVEDAPDAEYRYQEGDLPF